VSGYELAAYEPAQRDDYLRLLRDAWGERRSERRGVRLVVLEES